MFRSHLATALHFYDRGAVVRARVHVDRALLLADEQQHEEHAAELLAVKGTRPARAAAAALRAVLEQPDAVAV